MERRAVNFELSLLMEQGRKTLETNNKVSKDKKRPNEYQEITRIKTRRG
jgi:hypothetical protein